MRGPLAPLASVAGATLRRQRPVSPADFFLQCVSDSLARITQACPEALAGVEVGMEDVPDVTGHWSSRVPLAAAVEASAGRAARVVMYRRPIEHRASSRRTLRRLVHSTLVEQVSALTAIPVERLDPDGDADLDD
jgi:predicted Zn-dependent protease with MMP-like domain